jgi:hypothetical protein
MDGYTDRVSDSNRDSAACRELVFMCADTGAVVALCYAAGRRPALTRAVVFLSSGETLWIGGGPDGGARPALAVRDRGTSGQYDLRLSAQGALLPGPADLTGAEPVAGRRLPVGFELTVEPASARLTLGAAYPTVYPTVARSPGHVTLVSGTGSLAVGSIIHRVEGTGWSAAGPGGGPGAAAGCRAQVVFQDGSALYVAGETGTATGSVANGGTATEDAPIAALVSNTQIRAASVGDVTVRGAERGRPGRAVSWAGDGRSPAGATGQLRDPRQQVTVTCQDPSGSGWLSWSCAPFVFVRSGVTGLGLVERRARLATAVTVAEPAQELPDPF